jgi:hypothetical protein
MPPIYPTVPGQYVFPTPSSQVGATVYVNKTLDLVVADGVTLTANTAGNHYFSIGAQVTLAGTAYVIFDLDGTYTITGIPTANSFTCSTTLAGISYNGTVSSPGIQCGDIISYFSTTNSNLWVNNVTNKTWQITNVVFNGPGTEITFTTSAPTGFPVGQQVTIFLKLYTYVNGIHTVKSSTDTTFTINFSRPRIFVAVSFTSEVMLSTDGNTWAYAAAPQSDNWQSVTYGGGKFVAVSSNGNAMLSTDGNTWAYATNPQSGNWRSVTYGGGKFVAVSSNNTGVMLSTDGDTWLYAATPQSGAWFSVTYGGGKFVAVSYTGNTMLSTDGDTWVYATTQLYGNWFSVIYGDGKFVAVSFHFIHKVMLSTDGDTWVYATTQLSGEWTSVTYGGGKFVAVSYSGNAMLSTDGDTWVSASTPQSGIWISVTYGGGEFVAVSDDTGVMLSTDGDTWVYAAIPQGGFWYSVVCVDLSQIDTSVSDIVYLTVSPLCVTDRTFSSNVYPSISFANASDAAFWGFDSREGLTYSLPATPPWTLTQSGWISGFLPPSTSTYDDSVAHKLCKSVRVLVGKQTIKEYSGEYIELQNDLLVPYENKAILKLMNGTLDQTQATVSREYYVNLPLGTKEVPLCALTHQNMSVEIDFDSYLNLSQNLNQGTGDFLDAKSYTTYNASTGLLNGQPVNVQTTFSYQQYIFIVTYGGQFIIFDTTKNVDDPASYIVLSAFSGTSLFSQFCVLSGNLYIGLTDGQLVRGLLDELIQGNISSLELNSYTPTIGSLTGTIVADFRYVYYSVSNTVTSNVFFSRYDTTGVFTSSMSYTTFDFTLNIDLGTKSVYQFISTGSQIVALTNTYGKFYTFNINGNFSSSWTTVEYKQGYQITQGVLIDTTIYFVINNNCLIKYSQTGVFSNIIRIFPIFNFVAVSDDSKIMLSMNGDTWVPPKIPQGSDWRSVTYGSGKFVAVSYSGNAMLSTDGGDTWAYATTSLSGNWQSVTYGDGKFVAVSDNAGAGAMLSTDGDTWAYATTPQSGDWFSVTYGDGKFVAVGGLGTMVSTDGDTWAYATTPQSGDWLCVTYGGGKFVAVSYSGNAMLSTDGNTWAYATNPQSGNWRSVTYGGGKFVTVSNNTGVMLSTDGDTWDYATTPQSGDWLCVTYGGGKFVAVSYSGNAMLSTDGNTWVYASTPQSGRWRIVTSGSLSGILPYTIGNNITNLVAVGTTIYASSNSSTVSSVIEIDTSGDMNNLSAYKYYSSTDSTAPITFTGTAPMIFANGPRYVYMFAQGDNTAKNIVEFDPYGPDTTFKASILVDYESLPEGTKKPDKALLGLVQTQKVTDMTQMNIKGPVKELWVTGASATTNVFQYSNLATLSTLELAGEQIVTDDDGTHTFLNVIEPFETHTSMPIRNFSVVSFEFDPESEIPNGTVNFSRIRDQIFDGNAETVWARTYNLFAIQGGIGNLMYN